MPGKQAERKKKLAKMIEQRTNTIFNHKISSVELHVKREGVDETVIAKPFFKVGDKVWIKGGAIYDPRKEKTVTCPGCHCKDSYCFKVVNLVSHVIKSVEIHAGSNFWGIYYKFQGNQLDIAFNENQLFASKKEGERALAPAIAKENWLELARYKKRREQITDMRKAKAFYSIYKRH